MNVCERCLDGARGDGRLAAARWELFAFPEVRHVYRIGTTNRAAILDEGEQPDLGRWLAALRDAGYEARPGAGKDALDARPPGLSPAPREGSNDAPHLDVVILNRR